ncbi:hypothetical protein CVD25_21935 [Bacillus canaveralius]|uniref:Spore coat protein n=2 Tax=Bacillus canaveralius TaxID=1403243 RepID=A0ABX4SXS7_9BACI|nr:hypothetical protein CVD25_21935 [Bacillus canaveralius]
MDDYQAPFPSQVDDYQAPFPSQVGGAMDYQMPFPSQVGGAMDDYQAPFPSQVAGVKEDYEMPLSPQVKGVKEEYQPPLWREQMPQQMPVKGVEDVADSGCKDPAQVKGPFAGQGNPFPPPVGPAPGTAPIFTPQHGQFAQPPFVNPYGYGSGPMDGSPYGMPRYLDESNDNED